MTDIIHTFRHYLATLLFRLRGVTENAPGGFADFEAGSGVRSPIRILRHMSVLMYFAQHLLVADDIPKMNELTWNEELARFHKALVELDNSLLAMKDVEKEVLLKTLQGPLADAMTHVGQLATLRRLAGAPIKGRSFVEAEIAAGELK